MNFKTTLLGLVCFFCLGYSSTFANDDPCTATEINVQNSCTSSTFSNASATNTVSVPDPGCAGYSGGDIWFTFTMPGNGYQTNIELSAGTITDAGMAIYSGTDCSNLTLVSCDDNSGAGNMPALSVEDGCAFENIGETFWVRVWENGNDNNGTFDICAYATPSNIPAGVSDCGGNLIAGDACCDALLLGEDMDGYCGNTGGYTDIPDEIAPFCAFIDNNSWLAFIANDTDVSISISSSNCVGTNGIQVAILETTDCMSFDVISNCWNPGMEDSGFLDASGLTIGETYYIMIDGWAGDNCDYTLGIVSGIQTVSVTTEDDVICEGESTQLNANVIGSGTYTYSWSPIAGLDDPTSPNPIATPTVSTNYTVTITGVTDNVHSVSITVHPGIPTGLTVNGPTAVCQNSSGNIYTASATDALTYNWTTTGDATITGDINLSNLNVAWGTNGGTVCVTAENDCGVSGQECITVTTSNPPNISATDPAAACAPDPFDLTTIMISNSGGPGTVTYYDNLAEAQSGINDILPPSVTLSGKYYIRMASSADCYDIDSVDVLIEDPSLVVVNPGSKCSPETIHLDDVVINEVNGYPGGTKTYYADSLDATTSNSPLATDEVSIGGTYWVRYETPEGCFAVAPIEVNIDLTPDLTVVQPGPLCPSGTIDLNTVSYTDANNSTFTSTFYNNFTFANIPAAPISSVVSNAQTYYWRAETANGCYQIVEIDVTAGVTPDATITGGGTFCQGQNADITFVLNGSGPFDVVYTDGNTNFTLNGISNNHTIPVTVSTDSTFALVSVTDINDCSGNLLGSNVSITANPAPTATISGDATICSTDNVTLDFEFTGVAPFTAEYTDGTDTFSLNLVPANHSETVNVSASTTFTLISVTDGGSCPGTFSGSADITVYNPIVISNITETCDASFLNYTVSFDISGGDAATYSVTGGPGTLTGNTFTSNSITSGTVYNFSISDSNSGCMAASISGSQNCACSTDAGTMVLNPIEVCEDENAIATFNTGTNTLNAGDLFEFVLHDNAGGALGNVIARSSSPEFTFLPADMTFGTTYYISPIAGPSDGFGAIDENHVCFSIAQGTPVTFHALPVAVISGTASVCSGNSTDLTFNFTAGTGPFNIIVTSDVGPNISIPNVSDGDTYTVTPSENTIYTIGSVEDNTGAQCNGSDSGSATITVIETISISNIVENCNPAFTMYSVSFEITGGDAGSYNITGGTGNLVGNVYTSDPIASGTPYTFNVSDNTGCPAQQVSGLNTCTCSTDAGDMDLTPINVCADEMATATFVTGSNTLNTGDVAQFVLHDNSTAVLGNVIATLSTPAFLFEPADMTLGTTYYISPIAGPSDGSGNVDVNHLCFSIGQGTPVTFYELPVVTISGNTAVCAGTATDLTFNFTAGTGPFEVIMEDQNSNPTTVSGLVDGGTFSVTPGATTTYTIVSVTDSSPAVCSGSGTGSATVTINSAPQASNVQFVCNNINTQYQVTFEVSGGDPLSYAFSGDAGTFDNTTNTFTSNFINNGTPYNFQIDDANICGPVEVSGNHVCDCTSNAGAMETTLIEVCEDDIVTGQHITTDLSLDGNDVLGFILYDPTGTLPASLISTSTTPDFSFVASSMNYGITYHISAVVGDDAGTGDPVLDSLIDPCVSISNGQPIVFFENPVISISGDNTICQGEMSDLVFNVSGSGPFDIEYSDGVNTIALSSISDGHIEQVMPNDTTTYTLVSVTLSNAPSCDGSIDGINNTAIINVIEVPEVINLLADCNDLGTSFIISFEITGGNAALYNVSGDPGTLVGNLFTSDPLTGGSTYNFQIDDGSGCPPIVLSATEYCNCTPDIKPIISLDSEISCNAASDGILNVINENGQAPFNFQWSNGTFGSEVENLSTGWHFVTMTDGNNCLSVDSFFLDEPSPITSDISIFPLVCFGDDDAEIIIENVQGGAGGYSYSINYNASHIANTFFDLPSGAYEITIQDNNGCVGLDTIEILEPPAIELNLGEDVTLELGDSLLVIPQASISVDSFSWRPGSMLECADCWEQTIRPTETMNYSLLAMTADGCMATDHLTITVTKERPVFIPNIFTPNGDGENDILRVYSGGAIERIRDFKIFDRWGALVYEAKDLTPGIEDFGWDGRLKGQNMVQGTYVYFLEVIYKDGTSEIIRGDVSLIR